MRLSFIIPLAVFAVLVLALGFGLTLNPRVIPSALIDKPVPEFDLPAVLGRDRGFATPDLKQGKAAIVNIFASWCGPCRIEHPLWMEVAKQGQVPLHGIDYKDKPENARDWLDRYGDPYALMGADHDGRVGIDWGVYGVPETFVVDGQGRIAFKHVGVMTREILDQTIMPLIRELDAK